MLLMQVPKPADDGLVLRWPENSISDQQNGIQFPHLKKVRSGVLRKLTYCVATFMGQ